MIVSFYLIGNTYFLPFLAIYFLYGQVVKGRPISVEGVRKGYFFFQNGTQKGKGLDLGAEPPRI